MNNAAAPSIVNKRVLGIAEGRIVHYQFEVTGGQFVCRPAIIVDALRDNERLTVGEVNLRVFVDEANDPAAWSSQASRASVAMFEPHLSATSSSDEPARVADTWHFPERS